MKNNKNVIKGKRAEKRIAKAMKAKRLAGPNRCDLKKGKERIEVKHYKKPMTISQLKKASSPNHAGTIVSISGYTPETVDYSKVNMKRTTLKAGKDGKTLIKRKSPRKSR